MSPITYETLKIKGLQINHVRQLAIHQKINEHATASFTAEASMEYAKEIMNQATETMCISICNGDQTLFTGTMASLAVNYESDYALLEAELIAATFALDCQLESQSYQNKATKYSEVMQKATRGRAQIVFRAQDKATNKLIVQYKETSWSFLKRMALECNTFLVSDITASKPVVFVGEINRKLGRVTEESVGADFRKVSTEEFVTAGSLCGNAIITEVESVMRNGVLETTHVSNSKALIQKKCENALSKMAGGLYAGKIFMGKVQTVKRDCVQVHLTDIDEIYEEGGWWFPYSTLYSSATNEAGIYVMPKEGDPVRVFFPTEDAKDAFAASGKTVRGNRENKKEKCFETQNGMQVLFTEQGLYLTCRGKRIYINLDKEKGIELKANTVITMFTIGNFGISAYKKLEVTSEKEIFIGTESSFIGMKQNGNNSTITAFAPNIFVK